MKTLFAVVLSVTMLFAGTSKSYAFDLKKYLVPEADQRN